MPDQEITPTHISRFSFRNDFPKVFAFALAYFIAHGIAFFFPDAQKASMLIWPAAGIGLSAFLLNPRRMWPALTLSFYTAGIISDVFLTNQSLISGIVFMTGNMLESVGCASLIIYISKDFRKFTKVSEVVALIIGAVVINALTACIGAGTFVLARGSYFFTAWKSWYISDALGILLVGPFIISWIDIVRISISGMHSKKIVEWIIFILIWTIISFSIFYHTTSAQFLFTHHYMLTALIAWPAIRFGMKGTTMAIMILFIISLSNPVIFNVSLSLGGISTDMTSRLLEHQIFLIFMTFVGYLMAAFYSEGKHSEEELRFSEEKFRNVFENSVVGKSITQLNGAIKVNNAYCQMLGYSKNELSNLKWQDITHHDDIEITQNQINQLVSGNKSEAHFEKRFISKKGKIVWVDLSSTLQRSAEGKPLYLISALIDITDRKRAEDEIRTILRSAIDGFYVVDMEGRILETNDSYCSMIGYSREELLKMSIKNIEAVDDEEDIKNRIRQITETGYSRFETRHIRKDGKEIWIDASVNYLVQDQPKLFCFMRDITERIQNQEALNNKIDELQKFIKLTVGRELNMIELKKEVNELLIKSGQNEKYKIIS